MRLLSKFVVFAIVAGFVCCSEVSAQSKSRSKTSTKKSTKTSSQSSGAKGRLPKYFTHLKLKEEQRDEVFAVQTKYKKQIDDLMKELEELKEKQQDELYDVLSRTQKTLYNKYKAGTLKLGKSGKKPSSTKSSTAKKGSSKKSSSRSTKK